MVRSEKNGYTTDFTGSFKIEPEIPEVIAEYIRALSDTRRMKRKDLPVYEVEVFTNANIMGVPDFILGAKALPAKKVGNRFHVAGGYGVEGEFYVDGGKTGYNDPTGTVVSNNNPPNTQPGLWCQWTINEDGDLAWDEGEKFYYYEKWLQYLIDNVFVPNGYVLNGEVTWTGEDPTDVGTLEVVDNVLTVHEGEVSYKPKETKTKMVECYDCGARFEVECD